MANKPRKNDPVNTTADTSDPAALKPFPFRPLHDKLKAALEAARRHDGGPYYRHTRNDVINLILEAKLRELGYLPK